MARDWGPEDEAKHPRHPAGAPDSRGGEWAAAVATAMRPRRRYVESLDELEPDYEPGRWSILPRSLRVQQIADQHAVTVRSYSSAAPEEYVQERARKFAEDVVPAGTYLVNGPHMIAITTNTRINLNELTSEVDRMLTRWPHHPSVQIGVKPGDQMVGENGAIVFGEALRGQPYIWLNDRLFTDYSFPGAVSGEGTKLTKMPAAHDATGLRYTLAHEWGHTLDDMEPEVRQENWRQASRMFGMSGYGLTSSVEGYAEAFVEFDLTDGQTENEVAQMYARNYGWRIRGLDGD